VALTGSDSNFMGSGKFPLRLKVSTEGRELLGGKRRKKEGLW